MTGSNRGTGAGAGAGHTKNSENSNPTNSRMKKNVIHRSWAIYEHSNESGRRSADRGSTHTDGTERIPAPVSAEAALITMLEGIVGGLDYLVQSLQSSGLRFKIHAIKDKLIECFLVLAGAVYGPAEPGA